MRWEVYVNVLARMTRRTKPRDIVLETRDFRKPRPLLAQVRNNGVYDLDRIPFQVGHALKSANDVRVSVDGRWYGFRVIYGNWRVMTDRALGARFYISPISKEFVIYLAGPKVTEYFLKYRSNLIGVYSRAYKNLKLGDGSEAARIVLTHKLAWMSSIKTGSRDAEQYRNAIVSDYQFAKQARDVDILTYTQFKRASEIYRGWTYRHNQLIRSAVSTIQINTVNLFTNFSNAISQIQIVYESSTIKSLFNDFVAWFGRFTNHYANVNNHLSIVQEASAAATGTAWRSPIERVQRAQIWQDQRGGLHTGYLANRAQAWGWLPVPAPEADLNAALQNNGHNHVVYGTNNRMNYTEALSYSYSTLLDKATETIHGFTQQHLRLKEAADKLAAKEHLTRVLDFVFGVILTVAGGFALSGATMSLLLARNDPKKWAAEIYKEVAGLIALPTGIGALAQMGARFEGTSNTPPAYKNLSFAQAWHDWDTKGKSDFKRLGLGAAATQQLITKMDNFYQTSADAFMETYFEQGLAYGWTAGDRVHHSGPNRPWVPVTRTRDATANNGQGAIVLYQSEKYWRYTGDFRQTRQYANHLHLNI